MLIYVEKQVKDYSLTRQILSKFSNSDVIEIDHYKNIFDKKINYSLEKCMILAKLERPKIFPTPENYGYPNARSFFFQTQLNCVFDCKYCYLKGTFKNDFPVIFVNYQDIQEGLKKHVLDLRNSGYNGQIVYYASNYSDLLATENLFGFHQSFISFFEGFEGVLMESRTKSGNVKSLLDMGFSPSNTEIAFSLNPEFIVNHYEKRASSLEDRIEAIKSLKTAGWKVGLRFLPLLPVENYLEIYENFLRDLVGKIDIQSVNSIALASLIYNKQDWQAIQKKESDFDLLKDLQMGEDGLFRVSVGDRENFDKLFRKYFGDRVFWDYL